MRRILQILSWAALFGTLAPSCLYLAGAMDLPTVKLIMLLSTIAWFVATPFWMGRSTQEAIADECPAVD